MNEKLHTKSILITGAGGQLGQCIKKIENDYPGLKLHFTDSDTLDITNKDTIQRFFVDKMFDFVINCAAYTNVEQAEKEPEKAFLVNAEGVKHLAEVCEKYDTTLIHISTDYVFDGEKGSPYTEEDLPNPINVYGKSKLAGERYIQEILEKYFIIRTSWLYSEFGHNFFKTILKKAETEKELTVTTGETGTPTNANDLASFVLELMKNDSSDYGIYHYSNLGEATWYDFAKEILKFSGKQDVIKLEKTENYSTFAVRPKYSVLDTAKTERMFSVSIIEWRNSFDKILK